MRWESLSHHYRNLSTRTCNYLKRGFKCVSHVVDGQDDLSNAVGETLLERVIIDRGSNAQLSGQGINFLDQGKAAGSQVISSRVEKSAKGHPALHLAHSCAFQLSIDAGGGKPLSNL